MGKSRRDKRKFKIMFIKDGKVKYKLPGRKGARELNKALSIGELGTFYGFHMTRERAQ